jgi:Primase C terminal 1 (PriCT-1)
MLEVKATSKKESRPGALIGSDTNEELPTAQSQLPQCTLGYLEHGAPEGSRNAELHKHACQYRDAGIGFSEASELLGRRANLDGLSSGEIERTIASAYRGEQREPIGRGAKYSQPQARRTPKFRKIETEPEELPDSIERGDIELIKAAFKPGEFIAISGILNTGDRLIPDSDRIPALFDRS